MNYLPEMVLASFARELERENTKLKAEIAALTGGSVENDAAIWDRETGGFKKI